MFSLPVLAFICLGSVSCDFVSGYSEKSRSCMPLVMSLYISSHQIQITVHVRSECDKDDTPQIVH